MEKESEAEPTIGYIPELEKLQKTVLLPNYAINRQNELLFITYKIICGG
jgi:hypothetical protein